MAQVRKSEADCTMRLAYEERSSPNSRILYETYFHFLLLRMELKDLYFSFTLRVCWQWTCTFFGSASRYHLSQDWDQLRISWFGRTAGSHK